MCLFGLWWLAGLLDYMVDFGKKEVTVRGKVAHAKRRRKHCRNPFAAAAGWETKPAPAPASASASAGHARTLSWFLGCYGS